jgi:hypothetical protein
MPYAHLKTYDDVHYVCAENGGGGPVNATRTRAAQWPSAPRGNGSKGGSSMSGWSPKAMRNGRDQTRNHRNRSKAKGRN